ncbi:MAG: long-chain acyl-CoA synthetase [Bacillariaceae sp.]|jgi:long-chain acyl-CoA synthetase
MYLYTSCLQRNLSLSTFLFFRCFQYFRFRTGDLGKLLDGGWLQVTGRIKEQYKLENGKYIVPAPVENALGMSRFICQVVLVGANRPYNIALIVPEWDAIRQEFDLEDDTPEIEIVNDERVKKLIDNEILESCRSLKKYEIPKDWAFVAPFTAANNMITPKMSLRKHKIAEAYDDLISNLYGDSNTVSDHGAYQYQTDQAA